MEVSSTSANDKEEKYLKDRTEIDGGFEGSADLEMRLQERKLNYEKLPAKEEHKPFVKSLNRRAFGTGGNAQGTENRS